MSPKSKPKKQAAKPKKVKAKKVKQVKKVSGYSVKVIKEKVQAFEPIITQMEDQYMVVVTTPPGKPTDSLPKVMPALYGTAIGLKMNFPKNQRSNFGGYELYGRWPNAHLAPKDKWVADLALKVDKTAEEFFNAHEDIKAKILKQRSEKAPGVDVRFEKWTYGKVGLIFHIGPFAKEGPTIKKLHDYIVNNGYVFNGVHEEIYLSDPRRTREEDLKTVILYPIKKAADEEVKKFKEELQKYYINFEG